MQLKSVAITLCTLLSGLTPAPTTLADTHGDDERPPTLESAPDHNEARVHSGLYARAFIGLGTGSATSNVDLEVGLGKQDFSLTGVGVMYGGQIGLFVTEDLPVFVHAASFTQPNPTLKYGDIETTVEGLNTTYAFGLGTGYYFMPYNILVSGALSLAFMELSENSTNLKGASDFGYTGHLELSKEWPLAERIHIGVALQGWLGSIPDSGASLSVKGISLLATLS